MIAIIPVFISGGNSGSVSELQAWIMYSILAASFVFVGFIVYMLFTNGKK